MLLTVPPPGALRDRLLEVTAPFERARPLPSECHRDAAMFELEQRTVLKGWRLAGRASDAPLPGDWFLAPLGPSGVLVVRDPELRLRAFHNLCPHRGAPLVATPRPRPTPRPGAPRRGLGVFRRGALPWTGSADGDFTCPYHGLRYGLDGASRSEGTAPLVAVSVLEWCGFVLLSLAGRPPEFVTRHTPEAFRLTRLARLIRGHRRAFVTRANWKLLVANFQESHHFPHVHPGLERCTPWGRSTSFSTPGDVLGGTMELSSSETVSTDGFRHGRPLLPGLPDDHRRRVTDLLLFPCSLFSLQPDYLLSYQLLPEAAGRTRVVAEIWFDPSCRDGDGRVHAPDVTDFWDLTNREDRWICEQQQRALGSPAFDGGRYLPSEDGVHAFERRMADSLLASL